jgi:phage shock protein PspC (stress-responsive transcriptional regulator)
MDTENRQPDGNEEPTQAQPGEGQPEEPTQAQPEEPAEPQDEPTRPQAQPPPAAAAGPRRLFRSREDRVFGGVAGGLSRYFNVDAIFFRIGLVALVLFGGVGVFLYLAGLLLIPNEPAAGEAPLPPSGGRTRGATIAIVVLLFLLAWPFLLGGGDAIAATLVCLALLVSAGVVAWWLVSGEGPSGSGRDILRRSALGIGVVILCILLALGAAWAAATGGGGAVAAIVIVAGVAIVAGAFLRPVRWLVLPALVIALSAGTVSAADFDLDGGVGERRYSPATAAEIQDRYELGMGELVVDLRDTQLPPGDTLLRTEVGLGEIRVIVPEDVCVASSAEIGAGEVVVFDRKSDGLDIDWVDDRSALRRGSRLVLDADIGAGALHVSHDDRDPDRVEFDRFEESYAAEEENTGCVGTDRR